MAMFMFTELNSHESCEYHQNQHHNHDQYNHHHNGMATDDRHHLQQLPPMSSFAGPVSQLHGFESSVYSNNEIIRSHQDVEILRPLHLHTNQEINLDGILNSTENCFLTAVVDEDDTNGRDNHHDCLDIDNEDSLSTGDSGYQPFDPNFLPPSYSESVCIPGTGSTAPEVGDIIFDPSSFLGGGYGSHLSEPEPEPPPPHSTYQTYSGNHSNISTPLQYQVSHHEIVQQERFLIPINSQTGSGNSNRPDSQTPYSSIQSAATPITADIFSALGISDVEAPMTAETLIDTYGNEVVSGSPLPSSSNPYDLIEEVKCFKCKLCDHISLEKIGALDHIQLEHKSRISNMNGIKKPNTYVCSKCFAGFPTLSACREHMVAEHKIKVDKVWLEHIDNSKSSSADNSKEKTNRIVVTEKNNRNGDFQVNNTLANDSNCSTNDVRGSVSQQLNAPQQQLSSQVNGTITTNCLNSVGNQFNGSMSQNINITPSVSNSQVNIAQQAKPSSGTKIRQILPNGKVDGVTKTKSKKKKVAWKKKMKREQGTYICEFKGCNVRFRSHENLDYHHKTHSDSGSGFVCNVCSYISDHWSSMAGHLWREHSVDLELHKCECCSYRTYSLSILENIHRRIHSNERNFLCDVCGKGFKNQKQLINHKVRHQEKKCPVKKGDPDKKKKKKIHSCEICGRTFNEARPMRIHMNMVHNKLRPFVCSDCGHSAASRSALRTHMRSHTGEKPFKCDLCAYSSSDHNSLRRHKMRHSGERPYKCPFCTYACIQSSTYKQHLRNKHPGQNEGLMFTCDVCGFKTVNQDIYQTHISDHKVSNTGAIISQKKAVSLKNGKNSQNQHSDASSGSEASSSSSGVSSGPPSNKITTLILANNGPDSPIFQFAQSIMGTNVNDLNQEDSICAPSQ